MSADGEVSAYAVLQSALDRYTQEEYVGHSPSPTTAHRRKQKGS